MPFFDTIALESKHAAIRRALMVLSNQAIAPDITVISANEVLRLYRKHAAALKMRLNPEPLATDDATPFAACDGVAELGAPSPRKRKGGGGPWRAFVALNVGGGDVDFHELIARHKSISPDERRVVERLGAIATKLRR